MVRFGVDYYPDAWPQSRWEKDFQLMAANGFEVVRLAEFSWSKLEPQNGIFEFDWLDEVLRLATKYGIKVILGTPTAAPPAWLVREHPEFVPVDDHGVQMHFGGRHHECMSNLQYRQFVSRLVTQMAAHFGQNPAVIGWQIDNELGNAHGNLCYCDRCSASFRKWLKAKYHDIEALNTAWGTMFWSQHYNSFAEISAPMVTPSGAGNPSEILDWRRWHSATITSFLAMQEKIIRQASPGRLITHNMMGFAPTVNYYALGSHLDVAAQDQYPLGHYKADQSGRDEQRCAAELDFIRSVKQQSFWIMEQQANITGWNYFGRLPKPGQLALWSLQSLAHGADTILYFRWRSSPVGTEQYWQGLLPHDGQPGRVFQEITGFIKTLAPIMPKFQGSVPKAKAAIILDYDQYWAINEQPQHPDLNYIDHIMRIYCALYRQNIAVDFISADADLTSYKVVFAPLQYLMPQKREANLHAYVQNGGVLVGDMRFGVKNNDNRCITDVPLPGHLADVFGLTVAEYDCLRDVDVKITWNGQTFTGTKWADLIQPTTADVLARYDSEFYAGQAAITKHAYGSGEAYYVGTELTAGLADALAANISALAGEKITAPAGVEVSHRDTNEGRYWFVLNFTGQHQDFAKPASWQRVAGQADLEAYQYQVFFEPGNAKQA